MRVLLANDTATVPHVGCRAVSDGHARMLGRAGHEVVDRIFIRELDKHLAPSDAELIEDLKRDEALVERIDTADAVVVNGEGTIHHNAGRPLLALLALAQERGKCTLLVNAVFQENQGFERTLLKLDDFTVRESCSQIHARRLGVVARVVPDSILAAQFVSGTSRIDGCVVTDGHWQRKDVLDSLERVRTTKGATYLALHGHQSSEWATLPSRLSSASVLVTGRHHGVYLALLAGIPFVALVSNTHKIEGLLNDLGCRHLLAAEYSVALELIDDVIASRAEFSSLVNRLTEGAPLTTFSALGKTGEDREQMEVDRLAQQVLAVSGRR